MIGGPLMFEHDASVDWSGLFTCSAIRSILFRAGRYPISWQSVNLGANVKSPMDLAWRLSGYAVVVILEQASFFLAARAPSRKGRHLKELKCRIHNPFLSNSRPVRTLRHGA